MLGLFLKKLTHERAEPATARIMMESAMPELFDRDAWRVEGQLNNTHTRRYGREIAR